MTGQRQQPPKKPAPAKRAERRAWALADELARALVATCDLLDEFQGDGPMSARAVIERMQAYLDRRGGAGKQPPWVLRMRRTVARYESLKAHVSELH